MRTARLVSALAAPLLLAGTLCGLGTGQAATAHCQNWTGTRPPDPGLGDGLSGVAVLPGCHAWAVGDFTDPAFVDRSLTEYWNGSNWKAVPSPSPGKSESPLFSVSAASPTSVWAVGESDDGDGSGSKPLILHWNGTRWTRQRCPAPGSVLLAAVLAVSDHEAWAAGDFFTRRESGSLILHFTGGRWHRVKAPHLAVDNGISGLAATSARNVWAVGTAGNGGILESRARRASGRFGRGPRPAPPGADSTLTTLILHWNGRAWTRVASPSPKNGALLTAVDLASPANGLAVGEMIRPDNTIKTLALHWNGKSWTRVATPNPGPPDADDFLNGVTFTSRGEAWAVGNADQGITSHSLIEHWDGSHWTAVPAPSPGLGSRLLGIGSSSASNVWAVGDMHELSKNEAIALHCC